MASNHNACSLEGDKRICTTAQGDLKETILTIEDEDRIFKYAIDEQPLLPVQNVVGTMKVLSKNEGTELVWNMDFVMDDESRFPMLKKVVEDLYRAGASGLETISQ